MSFDLEDWACAELDRMGLPDASAIIQYLKPLEDPEEVESFLNSMMDITQEKHCEFIQEFLQRQAASKIDKNFYRKSEIDDASMGLYGKKKNKDQDSDDSRSTSQGKKKNKDQDSDDSKSVTQSKKKNKGQVQSSNNSGSNRKSHKNNFNEKENQHDNKTKGGRSKEGSPAAAAAAQATVPATNTSSKNSSTTASSKKKTKYVNLYTADQEVILLKGRHICDCLASKHQLINNCLFCGRIVCEQEGEGPCLFCGNVVQSKSDRAANPNLSAVNKGTTDKKNKSKITVKDVAADIQKAVDHKNKLLEFDRTSEKRTKVYDDECDYFDSSSRWHSKANREKLQALENELLTKKYDRSENRITIDLLGRKIIADESNNPGVIDPDDPILKAILEHKPDDIFRANEASDVAITHELPRPVYSESVEEASRNKERAMKTPLTTSNRLDRLQNPELQEMSDQGKCLSMHQPWASLLIAGIKKHEGRSWYSAHRGRLWIASTAKPASPEDVKELEDFYRMREAQELVFPLHYPPGCLLGCVDVVDVVSQEQYQDLHPGGESESPYVFICKSPQEMLFKFAMKGQHKIYSLDSKILQAAKKSLK